MAVLLCEALDDLMVVLVVVGLLAHEEEDVRLDEALEYLLRRLMVELDDERDGVPVLQRYEKKDSCKLQFFILFYNHFNT